MNIDAFLTLAYAGGEKYSGIKSRYVKFMQECEAFFRIESNLQRLSIDNFYALHSAGLSRFVNICSLLREALDDINSAVRKRDLIRADEILHFMAGKSFFVFQRDDEKISNWADLREWRARSKIIIEKCKANLDKNVENFDRVGVKRFSGEHLLIFERLYHEAITERRAHI